MGSVKRRGFNPFLDWSVVSLLSLQVWESEEAVEVFFTSSDLIKTAR
jgi:hypothetical protein